MYIESQSSLQVVRVSIFSHWGRGDVFPDRMMCTNDRSAGLCSYKGKFVEGDRMTRMVYM